MQRYQNKQACYFYKHTKSQIIFMCSQIRAPKISQIMLTYPLRCASMEQTDPDHNKTCIKGLL
jgi:hypothetical protein